jgi:hypothetical protein
MRLALISFSSYSFRKLISWIQVLIVGACHEYLITSSPLVFFRCIYVLVYYAPTIGQDIESLSNWQILEIVPDVMADGSIY